LNNAAKSVVLFALTGIGNTVLKALTEIGCKPVLLVSRQESAEYPYYEETQICEQARNLGIPVMYGEDGEKETLRLKPDVIFSATYHRLISNEVIASAKHAYNLHPSLLPLYPGKNPFYGVLINNEPISGVSIHRLTEKFDEGEIVYQKNLKIRPDETQGSLRYALAQLASEATKAFFAQIDSPTLVKPQLKQTSAESVFGQVKDHQRIVELSNTAELICRQVRALTPWPQAMLQELGCTVRKVIQVDRNASPDARPGTILSVDRTTARVKVADAEITFSIH